MPELIIRFIALHGHGLGFPFTGLILGHGHGDKTGLSHKVLAEIFCEDVMDIPKGHHTVAMYAGYLSFDGGILRLHKGGSETIGIKEDVEKNEWFMSNLQNSPTLRTAVVSNFPFLASGKFKHLMLARQ